MNSFVRIFILQAAAVCLCIAQSGFVRSGGQAIPGAVITLTQASQTVSTVTDADGHYAFPPLAQGAWSVSIEMFGFQPLTRSVDYAAQDEKPVNFDLELKPSALLQRMQQGAPRNAAASGTQAIDQQIQTALNTQQTLDRPAAIGGGSNESFLVSGSLSPGVSEGAQPDSGPEPRFGGLGELADASGNQAGSPFPQQSGGGGGGFGGGGFGGGPGGGPGGGGFGGGRGGFGGPRGDRRGGPGQPRGAFGNFRRRNQQIHGQLSFSLQNSELNAKPFSLNGLDIPQAAYAQSRFSAIVGGPLVIPKLVKDPSTQFFLSYFGTRAKTPRLFTNTVPTEAERNGDFSRATQSLGTNATSVPVLIYDPTTHTPYANNIIPATALNPIAARLLSFYPLPNEPGSANNYQFETAAPSDTDNLGLRIQRSITKADRLSLNFQYQRRDSRTAQPFGYSDAVSGYGLTANVGWTRNITAKIVSTLQLRFSRNRNEVSPYFASLGTFGIAGASADAANAGPPTLNFTNFASLSDSNTSLSRNQSQGFTESLTLLHGNHNFSFGGGYTRPDQAILSDPNGRGTFNFTGVATSAVNASGQTVTSTGYDLADFLLGFPQSSSIQYSGQNDYFLQNQFNLYVQDDWKIRPNFTAVLGVRYECFAPIHEKYGRLANLDIADGFTAVDPVTAGGIGLYSGAFSSGLLRRDYNNFSPRVAIAWKVTQLKRSTVVRAGYGMYYNGQAYLAFASQFANQPPFAVSNNVNTSSSDVLTLQGGFLNTTVREVTNTFAVGKDYRTPYAGTWNVSIQHDLGDGFFTEIGFLGTKGTGLDVRTVPFQAVPGSAIGSSSSTQVSNASGFTLDESVGNSIFNALQVRLNRRFNHGISFNAFYQFAKSIDNSSTFGGAGNTTAQNWLDISAERGLSSFDVRHQFQMGFNWTSPVAGPGSHMDASSLTGRLLKDWQVTGQVTAQTGNPLTARVLGNSQQLAQTNGVGSGRAEATGETIGGGQFFNLDAFTVPLTGAYGNAGRNTIPGPGTFSLNVALARSFNLSERRRIELRWETTNLLNHVNYTNLYTVVNATNYGLPSAAAGMRTMQAVLRFRF